MDFFKHDRKVSSGVGWSTCRNFDTPTLPSTPTYPHLPTHTIPTLSAICVLLLMCDSEHVGSPENLAHPPQRWVASFPVF